MFQMFNRLKKGNRMKFTSGIRSGSLKRGATIEAQESVFVYGTLKRGESNYEHYLKDATFITKAVTVDKFQMVRGWGFPYVYPQKGLGNRICGEVFQISKETKRSLDILEGVPYHYHEEKIDVELSNGLIVEAIIYLKTTDKIPYEDLIVYWEAPHKGNNKTSIDYKEFLSE